LNLAMIAAAFLAAALLRLQRLEFEEEG